jgi:hypothetical protein
MRILAVGENKIEIDLLSLFAGKETVHYNGVIDSRKKSMWGCVHSFNVKENGTDTHYEIKTGLVFPIRTTIVVTRNGELLFSDKSLKNPRGIQW